MPQIFKHMIYSQVYVLLLLSFTLLSFMLYITRKISLIYIPSLTSKTQHVPMTVDVLSFIHTLCQAEWMSSGNTPYPSLDYNSCPYSVFPLFPHLILAKFSPYRLSYPFPLDYKLSYLFPLEYKLFEFRTKIFYILVVSIVSGMSYELKNNSVIELRNKTKLTVRMLKPELH